MTNPPTGEAADAEALWRRALVAAARRGLLPAVSERLTPAEIAREAQRRGDARLDRLVRGYYYPAFYGRVAGPLSAAEAVALVGALEAGSAPPDSRTTPADPADALPPSGGTAPLCRLCRKRLPDAAR